MDVPVAGTVLLAALVWTFVDLLRHLRNGEWSPVLTQLIAWASGIAAVTLLAHTDFASTTKVAGIVLDKTSGPTLIFLGMQAASLAGSVVNVKQALDGSDSNAKPPLVP